MEDDTPRPRSAGPGQGRGRVTDLAVRDGENDLGRSQEYAIYLKDETVSRKPQAQIVHQDGIFVLRAVQPDRPVFLNDEHVADADALSDTVLRFRTIEG